LILQHEAIAVAPCAHLKILILGMHILVSVNFIEMRKSLVSIM